MLNLLILIFSGVAIFAALVIFLSKLLGVNLFGVLNELLKKRDDRYLKTIKIPEDDKIQIIHPKYKFSGFLDQVIYVGTDKKTKKPLLKFKCGDDVTPWTVIKDPIFFRIDLDNLFNNKLVTLYIEDDNKIINLERQLQITQIKNNILQKQINELIEEDKMKIQKLVEFNKNMRTIAFGWQNYPQMYLSRPWSPYRSILTPPQIEEENI